MTVGALSAYAQGLLCDLAAARLRGVSDSEDWLVEAAQRCVASVRVNQAHPGDLTFLIDLQSSEGLVRLVEIRADELLGADKAAEESELTLLQLGFGIPDDTSELTT